MTLTLMTIALGIGSLIFMGIVLLRVYNYTRKYPLPESKYTLLFGFIHFNHVTVLYVLSMILLSVFSMVYVISL